MIPVEPDSPVVFEQTRVHHDTAGSLVCVEIKHECFVRSPVCVLLPGRRHLPGSKSIEDVDQERGSRKRSDERTDFAGPEIATEDDDQHDEQAKE